MPAFKVKGSTGAAPVTSFFGPIPDALTLLSPMHENNSTNPIVIATDYKAATLVSQWIPFNTSFTGGANAVTCSFGANTSAPDGTNNGVHLTEAATNSNHYVTAGQNGGGSAMQRLQVFAKAAERTRVGISFYNNRQVNTGVKCIFDLSGGQIGVANHVFGSNPNGDIVAGPAFIIPFPNGWYLCSIEWTNGAGNASYQPQQASLCQIWIDSGSGTGSESTSYLGDGTSGIYVWRATSLPREAWSFGHNQYFFDDFNSISTIDVNRTGTNGFNWYLGDNWPGLNGVFNANQITPADAITVSSSAVSISNVADGVSNSAYVLWGAHTNNVAAQYPGGYVTGPNNTWQPPAWITWKTKLFNANFNPEIGLSTQTLENLTTIAQSQGGKFPDADNFHRGEIDIPSVNHPDELTGASGILTYGPASLSQFQISNRCQAANTFGAWNATRQFNDTTIVMFNNVSYKAINPGNTNGIIGQQPDISPTWWSVNTSNLLPYIGYTPAAYDSSQYHIYDTVWIPSWMTADGTGRFYQFEDGNYVNIVNSGDFTGGMYSYNTITTNPNDLSGALGRSIETGHHVFFLAGGGGFDVPTGTAYITCDYLKVRK